MTCSDTPIGVQQASANDFAQRNEFVFLLLGLKIAGAKLEALVSAVDDTRRARSADDFVYAVLGLLQLSRRIEKLLPTPPVSAPASPTVFASVDRSLLR